MTYQVGESILGFTLKRAETIAEIDARVYLFTHDLLGCPLLAIKNNDPNKTFSAAFSTVPTDSTGVAHILEHSVLMGSRKYPVKDVFGEINKGGLTTFLNAMTGSDITYYPFATRNLKEYFNIMDVYCDVVFNPLLSRSTFEQEGWHYHQESEDDPVQYQGVVFNEMKGAFSDPIRHIFHHIFNGLLPNSTYAHESGGDPRHIPDLSYKDFLAFHRKHYHPSNGFFFVYGDAPLADELRFLSEKYLSAYQQAEERVGVTIGKIADSPVFIDDTYAINNGAIVGKTFLAVGTRVATASEREKNAAFQVIANILFNSDGSPLKNAIVSSGLCKDFGGFYLTNSGPQTMMITYLIGSEPGHRDSFLRLYSDTLSSMAAQGLDRDLVVAELNKYEFSFREEASKAQRGLDLIGKAMTAFRYDTDPIANLQSEELIATIREKAMNGYFEELIKAHLLDNPATVTVTLAPDPGKQEHQLAEEQQRLQEYDRNLTEEQRQQRRQRTTELMAEQLAPNSQETLDLLPQLSLADLTKQGDFHAVQSSTLFGHQALINELPTNHISYLDIGFDLRSVSARLLPYVDLFGTILTEIGTKDLDYQRFAKEIATCTGAFSHSLNTYTKRNEPDSTRPVFWLHTKCLPQYLQRTLELIAQTISTADLGARRRIREIVLREHAWAEHSANSEGYGLAAARAFAHLSRAGLYNELFNGVTAYLTNKELAQNYDRLEETFLADLKEIASCLFQRQNLIFSATACSEELHQLDRHGACLLQALGQENLSRHQLEDWQKPRAEAFATAAEVVFAVQGGNLLPQGQGYNGHFEVLKTYLSRDYLWNTVRQMGGAYGCFIQFGPNSGNLAYISYRDPQVRRTYEAYDAVPEVVRKLQLSPRVLEQLVIGTYGHFDPLQSPAAKGATARNDYLNGIDLAFKQQRLAEIVATSQEDLNCFAEAFAQMTANSVRTIIGNKSKIDKDGDLFDTIEEL